MNVLLGTLTEAGLDDSFEILESRRPSDAAALLEEASLRCPSVLVLWSFYSGDALAAAEELQQLKAHCGKPHILHIAGGVHATAEPELTLKMGFDYVATGEGEETIRTVCTAVLERRGLNGICGLAHYNGSGVVNHGPGTRIALDDHPPFCAKRKKFNAIEITRGCVYACKFCQTPFMFKARFRHRSIENIAFHAGVMREHGLRDVRFLTPTSLSYGSDDHAANLPAVEGMLAATREAMGPHGRLFFGTFPSEVRPEHVTPEALCILKKYVTNNNLVIGGQSGSDRMLQMSSRGHGVGDVERAARLALEWGFLPNIDFIFGFPGEERADVEASVNFAERLAHLGARIHAHTFMPLPGTPWRREHTTELPPDLLYRLDRLISSRALYGQWRGQRAIAGALQELRNGRPAS